MSENIQPLLDRIRSEGVKKAEHERDQLLSDARAEAQALLTKAEEEIAGQRKQMLEDVSHQEHRQRAAMEQAARDLVLRTRSELNRLLQAAAGHAATASLSSVEVISSLLLHLIQAQSEGNVTIEAGSQLHAELQTLLPLLLQDVGRGEGTVLQMNPALESGFRLNFDDQPGSLDADLLARVLALSFIGFACPSFGRRISETMCCGAARI